MFFIIYQSIFFMIKKLKRYEVPIIVSSNVVPFQFLANKLKFVLLAMHDKPNCSNFYDQMKFHLFYSPYKVVSCNDHFKFKLTLLFFVRRLKITTTYFEYIDYNCISKTNKKYKLWNGKQNISLKEEECFYMQIMKFICSII